MLLKNARVDASQIALVGYCFGGMIGVEMIFAGVPLAAMVSIHGSFNGPPGRRRQEHQGHRVLIEHGAEDKPASRCRRSTRCSPSFAPPRSSSRYELYSGAGHGFSEPNSKPDERANTQSIQATQRFLKETFGI